MQFPLPLIYSGLSITQDKKADMLINQVLLISSTRQHFTQMSAEQFLPNENLKINLNSW